MCLLEGEALNDRVETEISRWGYSVTNPVSCVKEFVSEYGLAPVRLVVLCVPIYFRVVPNVNRLFKTFAAVDRRRHSVFVLEPDQKSVNECELLLDS